MDSFTNQVVGIAENAASNLADAATEALQSLLGVPLPSLTPSNKPYEVEFHSAFRFRVSIDDNSQAIFTELTLPNLQVKTTDIIEGGQNQYIHKLPLRVDVGNVILKHGITRDLALLEWYLMVMEGKIAQARRKVEITMFDVAREPLFTFRFDGAYPIKWTGPSMQAGSSNVAIEQLELVFTQFSVERILA